MENYLAIRRLGLRLSLPRPQVVRVLKSRGQKKYKPTLKNKETKTAPIYIPTTVNRIACCPSLCPTPHVSKHVCFIFANRRDEQLYPKVVLFFSLWLRSSSFHVFISHCNSFSGECLLTPFDHFSVGLVFFLNYINTTEETSSFSVRSIAHISPQCII